LLPSEEDSEQAAQALETFRTFSQAIHAPVGKFEVRTDSAFESVTLPRAAFDLLLQILQQMSEGKAVTIVPFNAELTTQQAAEFLNVSRPYVVKLIEEKQLHARHVGNRRRIRFEDLVAFKQLDDERRNQALDALSAESQALGLEY
jgi:excisionase family DNA binding protein